MPYRHTKGIEVWLHSFLTSVLDGGDYSTPHSTTTACPVGKITSANLTGCPVRLTACQSRCEEEKISLAPIGVRHTTVQPVAKCHIDCTIPAPIP